MNEHVCNWIDCSTCSISKLTKHKVLYRGSFSPEILFVGDAPAMMDHELGKAFVSPAGTEVFMRLINVAQERTLKFKWGVTNLVACFPYDDEEISARDPSKEEIKNCKPRLDDLIESFDTIKYYISLGQIAKNNPPDGIKWSCELDHPRFILRKGGVRSNEFKRNVHRLTAFINENGVGVPF